MRATAIAKQTWPYKSQTVCLWKKLAAAAAARLDHLFAASAICGNVESADLYSTAMLPAKRNIGQGTNLSAIAHNLRKAQHVACKWKRLVASSVRYNDSVTNLSRDRLASADVMATCLYTALSSVGTTIKLFVMPYVKSIPLHELSETTVYCCCNLRKSALDDSWNSGHFFQMCSLSVS